MPAPTPKTTIQTAKRLVISGDQVVSVTIDGSDDLDLTYTVPTGKTLTLDVSWNGTEE